MEALSKRHKSNLSSFGYENDAISIEEEGGKTGMYNNSGFVNDCAGNGSWGKQSGTTGKENAGSFGLSGKMKLRGETEEKLASSPSAKFRFKSRLFALGAVCVFAVVLVTVLVIWLVKEEAQKPENDLNKTHVTSAAVTTTLPAGAEEDILLFGKLKLNYTWDPLLQNESSEEFQEKSENFTSEIDEVFKKSLLSKYYKKTEVLSFGPGSIWTNFEIYFKDYVSTSSTKSNASVDNLIVNATEVLKNQLKNINAVADSLSLKVPSESHSTLLPPSAAVTEKRSTLPEIFTSVTARSSPARTTSVGIHPESSTTVQDPCEVISFDGCNSLGYRKTIYPNAFQDHDQAAGTARFLKSMKSFVDSSCSSSSQMLYCGLVFPKCFASGKIKVPCGSVCEKVEQECGENATIGLGIQCNHLTNNLDWCFIPAVSNATDLCERVTFELCRAVGFHWTVFPNFYSDNNQKVAIINYQTNIIDIVSRHCSANALHYYCSLLFPKCTKSGDRIPPCRSLCQAVERGCGTTVCNAFSEVNCFLPPNIPSSGCEKIEIGICSSKLLYNSTVLPTIHGSRTSQLVIERQEYTFLSGTHQNCSTHYWLFGCSYLLPQCLNGAPLLPCRSLCQAFSSNCPNVLPVDCGKLIDDDDPFLCIPDPTEEDVSSWTKNETNCSSREFACRNGNCISSGAQCDGTNDCGDLSDELPCGNTSTVDCNFEDGSTCSFRHEEGNDFNWTVHSGPTPSAFTGPVFDDTYQNLTGKYLYIEVSGRRKGSKARIVSPELHTSQMNCLRFSFHLRGDGIGYLQIYLSNSSQMTPVWLVKGDKGKIWQRGQVSVPPQTERIVMEAVRGNNHRGDIAIDDITLRTGACTPYGECTAGFSPCTGTDDCYPSGKICDGVADCMDHSDEMKCDCDKHQYQCAMGLCIKFFERCDNITQCPDGSDEKNCSCPKGQYVCPDGKCIMSEWLCDGQWDCHSGADEKNCDNCVEGMQFTCSDNTCLNSSNRCDGKPDCPDGSDESHCVVLKKNQGVLLIVYAGISHPVCALSWNDSLGQTACHQLSFGSLSRSLTINYASSQYVFMNPDGNLETVFGKALLRNSCENSLVVGLVCEERGCGRAPLFSLSSTDQLVPEIYIVGGSASRAGRWPWQVSIQRNREHICGGSIINKDFILTAAHCVDDFNADLYNIVMGSLDISKLESVQQRVRVKRKKIHPGFSFQIKNNDIALLQLSRPINFTDYIQPVCLTEKDDTFTPNSLCYSTGWGRISVHTYPTILQEAKMKLWKTSKCNSSVIWGGQIHTSLCAGYYSGLISVCKGDSGGPLVCQGQNRLWKLVGITSFTYHICDTPMKPGVFTNVKQFLPWIDKHTKCVFKCDNGDCLYEKNMVCDRHNDCEDKSDEIQMCTQSPNCTFDDAFLCGYELSDWRNVGSPEELKGIFPKFDHTHGGFPGRYMFGELVMGNMRTPRFDLAGPHCVRFFYYAWDVANKGLVVNVVEHLENGSSLSRELWHLEQYNKDLWKMASFDLPKGSFQIEFVSLIIKKVAVDDVLVRPGSCESLGCLSGEAECRGVGDKVLDQCFPEAIWCNTVANCPSGLDEQNCTATSYKCTFDNSVVCGLQQYGRNDPNWLIVPASFYKIWFVDHTVHNYSGHLAFLATRHVLSGMARMVLDLHLRGKQHCLTFYFQVSSTNFLRVSLKESHGQVHALWNFTIPRTHGWTKAQLTLPSLQSAQLWYDAIGQPADSTVYPFIALDDISIIRGQCGNLTCLDTWTPCASENQCTPINSLCNRKVDCMDESDEANCNCTSSEFKCGSGRCLSSTNICNGRKDCLDESDEAKVCDSSRKVTCDFEQPFACGYAISGSAFKWIRKSGSTDSVETGPNSDHTLGNSNGHYMYTEASYGEEGDLTFLSSSPFTISSNSSLRFFYYMHGDGMGTLNVTVKKMHQSQNEDDLAWSRSSNQGDKWHSACLNLTLSNQSLSVIFVAVRGGTFKGDMAVDDIKLYPEDCSSWAPDLSAVTR